MAKLRNQTKRLTASVICLLAMNLLSAQDLPEAWANYITANTALERASNQELQWTNDQAALRMEMQEMNAKKSWYNEWAIELRIARKVAQEVKLAGSIELIQTRIVALRSDHKASFKALKYAYSGIVLAGDTSKISLADYNQTVEFAQLLEDNGRIRWDFPDYSAMMAGKYESEQLKQLILGDLRSVLGARLTFIDSVVAEKVDELALIERLQEFQADLSYQLESNIEFTDDADINKQPELAGGFGSTDDYQMLDVRSRSASDVVANAVVDLAVSNPSGVASSKLPNTIGGQIAGLKLIRQQYENIIVKIDSALAN